MEELAGILLSPARSGTRDGIVSLDGLYSWLRPRGPWPSRSERGDAAGALKAFEELARLEPGNAELHSKAAAARTLITSGR